MDSRSDPAGTAGACSPEDLDRLFEDVWVMRDAAVLPTLFEPGAAIAVAGRRPVSGPTAIGHLIAEIWHEGDNYLALPPRVVQAGPTALLMTKSSVHVARRGLQGWRFLISWLPR